MYCPRCGTQNDANATRCVQCGENLPRENRPPIQQNNYNPPAPNTVPNYLVQSILTTLCCCLPFGIVAIVHAASVNGKLATGDYDGAVDSSNKAKMWAWIAFGVGLPLQIIIFLIQIAVGLSQ